MSSDVQFIGIKRITRDKTGTRVFREETIRIKDIKSLRPWHKTDKENDIKGDITLIVSDGIDKNEENNKIERVDTILVHEAYPDFLGRLGSVVVIK